MADANDNFEAFIATYASIRKTDSDEVKRKKLNLIKSSYFKDGRFFRENFINLTNVRVLLDSMIFILN